MRHAAIAPRARLDRADELIDAIVSSDLSGQEHELADDGTNEQFDARDACRPHVLRARLNVAHLSARESTWMIGCHDEAPPIASCSREQLAERRKSTQDALERAREHVVRSMSEL